MQRYEFKVIPAPRRGEKHKGLKTTEERFAHALTLLMNEMGAEGWDYIRADILPCDERSGLTGTKTSYQNMLVFRRAIGVALMAAPSAGLSPAAILSPVATAVAPGPSLAPIAAAPAAVFTSPAPVATAAANSVATSSMAFPEMEADDADADADAPAIKLGAAHAPLGATPSLGPAKGDLAAE